VLAFGLVSSVAWSLLLFAAGAAVGHNRSVLVAWLQRYTWAAWGILAVVVIGAVVRHLLARRRAGER